MQGAWISVDPDLPPNNLLENVKMAAFRLRREVLRIHVPSPTISLIRPIGNSTTAALTGPKPLQVAEIDDVLDRQVRRLGRQRRDACAVKHPALACDD